MKTQIKKTIAEALGESSALFMSQERRGVDMEMPTEELIKIAERATVEIEKLSAIGQMIQ